MDTIKHYCANCDTPALVFVKHPKGERPGWLPLCKTCVEAFRWGQERPQSTIYDIFDVVILLADDIDRDVDRAGVHPFNANGKSYGVAAFPVARVDYNWYEAEWQTDDMWPDPMWREYAPSVEAAMHNAKLRAENDGLTYLEGI